MTCLVSLLCPSAVRRNERVNQKIYPTDDDDMEAEYIELDMMIRSDLQETGVVPEKNLHTILNRRTRRAIFIGLGYE